MQNENINFDAEAYSRTFSSFSGADVVATFNGRAIGELQGISYTVTREKAPVYTMGSPDPRSFSRGKRSVSGQVVFAQFDRDALVDEMNKSYAGAPSMGKIQQYKANMWTHANGIDSGIEQQILKGLITSTNSNGETTYGINTWDEQMTKLGYATTGSGFDPTNLTDAYEAEYADQLLPFNVAITMANEYGARAGMEIYGLELLNESSGFSIDDVISAKAYTFVARKLRGVKPKQRLLTSGHSGYNLRSGKELAS